MGRKWNNIKEKKGAQDKLKGQIYTRALAEVTKAVKQGGEDAHSNFMLKIALNKCKVNNVPRDNIEKAIKKGLGTETDGYDDVNYEGYGPNGVAVFVETSTNNVTRTVANIRNYFNKCHGSLGTTGCLQFVFDRKAVFEIPATNLKGMSVDDFTLEIIDSGAEDVVEEDGFVTVTGPMESFGDIHHKLDAMGIESQEAGLERIPTTFKEVDQETFNTIMKLTNLLEEDDDVTKVYHNIQWDDKFNE